MLYGAAIKSRVGQITQKLFRVHEQIEKLKLPVGTYAVITIDNDKLKISELGGETTTFTHHLSKDEWMFENAKKNDRSPSLRTYSLYQKNESEMQNCLSLTHSDRIQPHR